MVRRLRQSLGNKNLTVGPGGVGCACCFPPPGSKMRKYICRMAKRKGHQEAVREALKQISDESEEYSSLDISALISPSENDS